MEKPGDNGEGEQDNPVGEEHVNRGLQEDRNTSNEGRRVEQIYQTPAHQSYKPLSAFNYLKMDLIRERAVLKTDLNSIEICMAELNAYKIWKQREKWTNKDERQHNQKDLDIWEAHINKYSHQYNRLKERLEEIDKKLKEFEDESVIDQEKSSGETRGIVEETESALFQCVWGFQPKSDSGSLPFNPHSDRKVNMNVNDQFNTNSAKLWNLPSQDIPQEIPKDSVNVPPVARPKEEEKEKQPKNLS